MADTKISALTALAGSAVDTAADVLPIVDTSVTTTKKILVDELRKALLSQTALTNSLSGDVTLNNTVGFFDGPVVAQGTTGTWYASGTVTMIDTSAAARFVAKLWDGTTVIASAVADTATTNGAVSISLSGYIASPAGNIRISVLDASSTNGLIKADLSGSAKDSTISAVRIG